MPNQSSRNDAPITAKRDEWMPLVAQAAERRSTRGLPIPPPGLPRGGVGRTAYYTTTRSELSARTLRVWVKWCVPGVQTWVLGSYAVPAAGRVPVGRIITLGCGRQVRVAIDAAGLPYPVPVVG